MRESDSFSLSQRNSGVLRCRRTARAQGVFASVATVVRSKGGGGEFASALLLSAAVSAMMSTADGGKGWVGEGGGER